jgi:hypothetical protein
VPRSRLTESLENIERGEHRAVLINLGQYKNGHN